MSPRKIASNEYPIRIEIINGDAETQEHRVVYNPAKSDDGIVHESAYDEDVSHENEGLERNNSWTLRVKHNVVSISDDEDSEEPNFTMDRDAAIDTLKKTLAILILVDKSILKRDEGLQEKVIAELMNQKIHIA